MAKTSDERQSFEAFLESKKIDSAALRKDRAEEYAQLSKEYWLLSENSFDQQKKFIFNPLRLEFPLLSE